ncbi:MAG: permease [Gemmatimonadetes bacterium]|nr:permease [Gemmatimonadota bacterium]
MSLDPKTLLLAALGVTFVYYLATTVAGLRPFRANAPSWRGLAIGAVTNFFDTLGIGSYATTTAIFRATNSVPVERIPGTLNAGHTMATLVQTVIFTKAVDVDPVTLIGMIMAAVSGSLLGANSVARWPKARIQRGMGLCLAAAAALFVMQALNLVPGGGTAIGVTGVKLGIALLVNFVLGALMTIGIGLYGPCMLLVSMLGMNPVTAFPIMMGSCAFLMPAAGARFMRLGAVDKKAVFGLIVGGVPAVLVAVYLVKSLPLTALRWLVAAVVAYTAWSLLRSAATTEAPAAAPAPSR